jgi:hypothetical protein
MGVGDRIMRCLGWEQHVLNIAALVLAGLAGSCFAALGGCCFAAIALMLRWKAATLINATFQERIPEAVAVVKQESASKLCVQLSG